MPHGTWDRTNFLGEEILGTGNRQNTNNVTKYAPSGCLPVYNAPETPAEARTIYDDTKKWVDDLGQGCGKQMCSKDELPAVRFMLPKCDALITVPTGHFFQDPKEFQDFACSSCEFPVNQVMKYQGYNYENMMPRDLFPNINPAHARTSFAPGPMGRLIYNYAEGPGNQGIPTRWDPLCPVVPRHFPLHGIHYDAAACSGLEPWLTGQLFYKDTATTATFAGCSPYDDHTPEVVGAEDILSALFEIRDEWLFNLAQQGITPKVWEAALSPCEQSPTAWDLVTANGASAFGGCCLDPSDFTRFYQTCPSYTSWKSDWNCCYCPRDDEGPCELFCLEDVGGFVFGGEAEVEVSPSVFKEVGKGGMRLFTVIGPLDGIEGGYRLHGSAPLNGEFNEIPEGGFNFGGEATVIWEISGLGAPVDECPCDDNHCLTGSMCCFVETNLSSKDFGPERYNHLRVKDTRQIDCFYTSKCQHTWYPGHRYFYLNAVSANSIVTGEQHPVTGYRISEDLLYKLSIGAEPLSHHIANSNIYLFKEWPLFMVNRSDFEERCIRPYPWPQGVDCVPPYDPCDPHVETADDSYSPATDEIVSPYGKGRGFALHGSVDPGETMRFHGTAPVSGGKTNCIIHCANPLENIPRRYGPINQKDFILRCVASDRATMRNPQNICFSCEVGGTTWIYHHRLWKPQLRGTAYDPLSSIEKDGPHRIFAPRYYEGHGGMTRLMESNSHYYLVTSEGYQDTNGYSWEPCCTVVNSMATKIVDRDSGTHVSESAHAFYLGDHIIPKYDWQNLGDSNTEDPATYCANNHKGLRLNNTLVGKCGTRNAKYQPPISIPPDVTRMIVPVDLEAFTSELTDWAHTDEYEPVGCNVPRVFKKGYDRQTLGNGTSTLYLIDNNGSAKRTTTYALSRRLYRREGFARQGSMYWLDGICNPTTDEYHSGVPCVDLNPATANSQDYPNLGRNLTMNDPCVGTDYRCGKGIPLTDERCDTKKICVDPHVTDYELALMELHPLYSDGYECSVSVDRLGDQYQSQDYCQNECVNTIEIYDVLQNDGSIFEVRIGHLNVEQIPGNGVNHLGDNCLGESGYSFAANYYIVANFSVTHLKVKYGSSAGTRCDNPSVTGGFPISKCEEEAVNFDWLSEGTHIFGGGIDPNILLNAMYSVPFQNVVDGECICSENFTRYFKWDAQFSMSIKPYHDPPNFQAILDLAPSAAIRVEEALNNASDKDARGYLYGVIPPWSQLADGTGCPVDIPAVYQSPDAAAQWFTESVDAGAVTLSDATLAQYGYTRSDAEYHYSIYNKLQDLKNNNPNEPHDIPSDWGPATYAALMFRLRKVSDKMGEFDPLSGCEMDTNENPPEISWPDKDACLPGYVQCCGWCDPNKFDCEQLDGTPCYGIGCPRDIEDGGCPSGCSASDYAVPPSPTCTNSRPPCEELTGIDFIVYPCDGSRITDPCTEAQPGGGSQGGGSQGGVSGGGYPDPGSMG